jgi:hypothetical protein
MKGLNAIFGGSQSKQQSTSTPIDMNPFKGARGGFMDVLSSLYTSGGGPAYQGPLVAGIGDAEKRGLVGTEEAAFNPARRQMLDDTLRGQYLPGQPGGNPFFQQAVEAAQRPLLMGLTRTLGREMPSQFALRGQRTGPRGSSAFDRAGNIATEGVANAMGDISTRMGSAAWDAGRKDQLTAAQLGQGEVDVMVKNLTAQGLPRLIADLGITRGMEQFNKRLQSLFQALQLAAGVLTPNIANQAQSSGSSYEMKGIIPGLKGTPILPPAAPV